MKHEEIIEIVRNTNNFGDPEGDYDFNGIVHIMLARDGKFKRKCDE